MTSTTEPRPRPWGWHLVRASAIVLVVLLPVEMVSWLLTTDIAQWTALEVAARWESPLWRVIDWSFLVLGVLHGALGTREWLARTLRPGPLWAVTDSLVLVTSAALLTLGSHTALTFGL